MSWHAVVLLLSARAARGAEVGDAESAMAARIELLKEENAKIARRLETVRGAISYWGELGFTPDGGGGILSRARGPRGIGRASRCPRPRAAPGKQGARRREGLAGRSLAQLQERYDLPASMVKARPLWLLRARLAAPGSSALPERGRRTLSTQPRPRALEPAATCPALLAFRPERRPLLR